MAGEITTLKHELRDDAMEGRSLITDDLALWGLEPFAELSKVLSGAGDNVIIELEVDASLLSYKTKRISN